MYQYWQCISILLSKGKVWMKLTDISKSMTAKNPKQESKELKIFQLDFIRFGDWLSKWLIGEWLSEQDLWFNEREKYDSHQIYVNTTHFFIRSSRQPFSDVSNSNWCVLVGNNPSQRARPTFISIARTELQHWNLDCTATEALHQLQIIMTCDTSAIILSIFWQRVYKSLSSLPPFPGSRIFHRRTVPCKKKNLTEPNLTESNIFSYGELSYGEKSAHDFSSDSPDF